MALYENHVILKVPNLLEKHCHSERSVGGVVHGRTGNGSKDEI